MQMIETITAMQRYADELRRQGRRIGFVPTMGYLHEGHAALMREAKHHSEVVVVSIFVNPTQFAPHEDYARYPRDFERDRGVCAREGVEVIFVPSVEEMYPTGAQTWVTVTEVSQDHCGASRPGHFRGVATVVTKLFLAVKPHVAVFGEKDYQQLAVIRQMARDLNFGIEVIGVPTVREADGLAMSSRNMYLSPEERQRALSLYQALQAIRQDVAEGQTQVAALVTRAEAILQSAKAEIDYIHIADPVTLRRIDEVHDRAVVLIAARIGATRLIDNATVQTRSK